MCLLTVPPTRRHDLGELRPPRSGARDSGQPGAQVGETPCSAARFRRPPSAGSPGSWRSRPAARWPTTAWRRAQPARPASAPSSARCWWFCPRRQEGELPLGEERCRTFPPRGLTGEGLLNGGQGLLAALPAWASRSSAAGRTRCILAKKPIRKPSCRICTPSLPTRHGATFRRAPGRCQVVACMRNDLLLTCSGIPVDESEPQTPRRFREIRGRTRPPSRTRLHGLAENKQQGVPTLLTP